MSTLGDARSLLQDIVAPDLKAIAARLDGLEKAVKIGFETSERTVNHRFEAVEKAVKTGFEVSENQ